MAATCMRKTVLLALGVLSSSILPLLVMAAPGCAPTKAEDGADAAGPPVTTNDGGDTSDASGSDDAQASNDSGLPPIEPCPSYEQNNPKHHQFGQQSATPIITADQTWKDGDVYFIYSIFEVKEATLTIEGGARVCLTPGGAVPPTISVSGTVAKPGKVIAAGTPSKPIIFDRLTKDDSYSGFTFGADTEGTFENVRFNQPGVGGLGVLRFGANYPKAAVLKNVHFENFYKVGLNLQNPAGLSADSSVYFDSQNPTEDYAIITAMLKPANTLTSTNTKISPSIPASQRVVQFIDANITEDLTLKGDLGAAYAAASGDLIIRQADSTAPVPTLTIEAGTELRFSQGELRVGFVGSGNEGSLAINGTATSPVLLTSKVRPAERGQWNGVTLYVGQLGTKTAIRNVKIENAGGGGGANIVNCRETSNLAGAIKLRPVITTASYAGPIIENVEVTRSGGDGIAFNCVAAGCLTTDYTTQIKGADNAGPLFRPLGCP